MILTSKSQLNLYGLDNQILELINLYNKDSLPNKILFSGVKGIGKCTLAYHLINYILSIDEDFSYDKKNFSINPQNKSYKLILNKSNPNFHLVDVSEDKMIIDINQIREVIKNMNKSSFNQKPRFVLIDNIEYLNDNSVNSLLKSLEEPNSNYHFILIHNNRKILPTLLSRCINYKIFLPHETNRLILDKIFNDNIYNKINKDFTNYYFTPGTLYNLFKLANELSVDLKDISLKDFIKIFIKEKYYKINPTMKEIIYNLIELSFLDKKFSHLYSYFVNKMNEYKRFNLDDECIFIEYEERILNG